MESGKPGEDEGEGKDEDEDEGGDGGGGEGMGEEGKHALEEEEKGTCMASLVVAESGSSKASLEEVVSIQVEVVSKLVVVESDSSMASLVEEVKTPVVVENGNSKAF